MVRTCKRGHIVDGKNAKRRPSTKYVACRKCEELSRQASRACRKSVRESRDVRPSQ